MDYQIKAACEYMRHNANAKQTVVTRQYQVIRDQLRTRVQEGPEKRGSIEVTTRQLAVANFPISL